MTPTNNAELLGTVKDLQQRMGRIENDVGRLQQIVNGQDEDIKAGAKSSEVNLRLENLRLVTDGLKNNVTDLSARLGGLETNIVKRVEDISKKQQEESVASMRRIIIVQGAVLMSVVAAILGVIIPIFFHR